MAMLSKAGAEVMWRGVIGDDPYVQLWRRDPDGERLDLSDFSYWVRRIGERVPYRLGMQLSLTEPAHGLLIETAEGQLRYAERFVRLPLPGDTITLSAVPLS